MKVVKFIDKYQKCLNTIQFYMLMATYVFFQVYFLLCLSMYIIGDTKLSLINKELCALNHNNIIECQKYGYVLTKVDPKFSSI